MPCIFIHIRASDAYRAGLYPYYVHQRYELLKQDTHLAAYDYGFTQPG